LTKGWWSHWLWKMKLESLFWHFLAATLVKVLDWYLEVTFSYQMGWAEPNDLSAVEAAESGSTQCFAMQEPPFCNLIDVSLPHARLVHPHCQQLCWDSSESKTGICIRVTAIGKTTELGATLGLFCWLLKWLRIQDQPFMAWACAGSVCGSVYILIVCSTIWLSVTSQLPYGLGLCWICLWICLYSHCL
jgi:hypothetical protein